MNVDDLMAVLRKWCDDRAAEGDHLVAAFDAPTQRRVVMAGLRTQSWDPKKLEGALRTKRELLPLVPEISRVLTEAARNGARRERDERPAGAASGETPADTHVAAGTAPPASSAATSPGETAWQLPRYAFAGGGPEAPRQVAVAATDAGLAYTWEPWERSGGAVYRVVTSEVELPYSPDEFSEVAVTEKSSVVDQEPPMSAIRYVTVWAYPRPASGSVVVEQPILLAVTEHVHQLEVERLALDGTTVVGRWRRPIGATRVVLARLPAHEAGRALATGGWRQYRILEDRDNLGGFTDADLVPGQTYRYVGVVEVQSGTQVYQSVPTVRSVSVPARLAPVRDLRVTEHHEGGRSTFDVRWTDPGGGVVEVYRTQDHPTSGLEEEVDLTHDMLEAIGLAPAAEVVHPVVEGRGPNGTDDGTRSINGVAWPEGPDWERAYFTPVTVIGERVRVGRTVVATRTTTIDDIRVVQRATRQIVTFSWPGEAAEVGLYVTALGAAVPEQTGPAARIDRDRYRDFGGFVLDRPLPPQGCTLHLVPVSYYRGEAVVGQATSVNHGWYVLLRYELRRKAVGRRCDITVHVVGGGELIRPPAFVLVHNPERLPLHRGDGSAVVVVPEGAPEGSAGSPVIRPARLGNPEGDPLGHANLGKAERRGYLRLFVDAGYNGHYNELVHWGLLDPSVRDLFGGQRHGWPADLSGALGRGGRRG